jgi:hypothetical protein
MPPSPILKFLRPSDTTCSPLRGRSSPSRSISLTHEQQAVLDQSLTRSQQARLRDLNRRFVQMAADEPSSVIDEVLDLSDAILQAFGA